jgi:hypothetical protein
VRKRFGVREHLKDGRLTLYLSPASADIAVGDSFTFHIGLQDEAMPEPVVTEAVSVRIVAAVDKPEPPDNSESSHKAKQKSGAGDRKSGKGEDAPTHGLPACVLLTQDGREVKGYAVEAWPEDFNETDGGVIQPLGNGENVYKINYDNAYHLKYRKAASGVARDVVTEKYILGMRILLLGSEHALRSLQDVKGSEGIGEFLDEFRRMAARGAASTVLALAENLPKIVDASSIQQGENVE